MYASQPYAGLDDEQECFASQTCTQLTIEVDIVRRRRFPKAENIQLTGAVSHHTIRQRQFVRKDHAEPALRTPFRNMTRVP
ncbi:uncharacterized protein MEPE_03453 [Melanopsichium pennsylvanicum]|uniref:Uncharacterized protein n=1 Tax=Melanopsichium pennsylvanicum TaxID=63383 RepID=A0AAJ4XL10_9BASI|nr:uncharacterized protein MEPE_03453 [Melanopsichium pennsylvanicum]